MAWKFTEEGTSATNDEITWAINMPNDKGMRFLYGYKYHVCRYDLRTNNGF